MTLKMSALILFLWHLTLSTWDDETKSFTCPWTPTYTSSYSVGYSIVPARYGLTCQTSHYTRVHLTDSCLCSNLAQCQIWYWHWYLREQRITQPQHADLLCPVTVHTSCSVQHHFLASNLKTSWNQWRQHLPARDQDLATAMNSLLVPQKEHSMERAQSCCLATK